MREEVNNNQENKEKRTRVKRRQFSVVVSPKHIPLVEAPLGSVTVLDVGGFGVHLAWGRMVTQSQ